MNLSARGGDLRRPSDDFRAYQMVVPPDALESPAASA